MAIAVLWGGLVGCIGRRYCHKIGVIASITLLLPCIWEKEALQTHRKVSEPETSIVDEMMTFDGFHGLNEFTNNLEDMALLPLSSSSSLERSSPGLHLRSCDHSEISLASIEIKGWLHSMPD